MPAGPGKYDAECTTVRLSTQARGVIVIVCDGNRGTGFSVQVADPRLLVTLPEVLEDVAQQIRESGP